MGNIPTLGVNNEFQFIFFHNSSRTLNDKNGVIYFTILVQLFIPMCQLYGTPAYRESHRLNFQKISFPLEINISHRFVFSSINLCTPFELPS